MPRMHKRYYSVVSLTVATLGIIGGLTKLATPYLPPTPLNNLQFEEADYLRQGNRQDIDWMTLEPESFAEARRQGKPIMLVLGAAWSLASRNADRDPFANTDVQAFLSRYMICIRVDLDENPEWIGSVLPLKRAASTADPGFQVYFLDPNGEVFDEIGTMGVAVPLDWSGFLQKLREASSKFARIQNIASGAEPAGAEQETQLELLTKAKLNQLPDPYDFEEILRKIVDLRRGGFVQAGVSELRPQALYYLLRTGRIADFRALVDPLLRGPHVDWIDGGFFRKVIYAPRLQMSYDKVAVENAEMMSVLAFAGVLLNDELYKRVARMTFDSLSSEFIDQGVIAAARQGDERENRRSQRSSVSVRELRDQFWNQRDWMRRYFNLQVETNPLMTVQMPHPEIFGNEPKLTASMLLQVKKSRPDKRRFVGKGYASISASVLARLIQTAALLQDKDRLRTCRSLLPTHSQFLASDDVIHTRRSNARQTGYLGDYLAYADAMLQWYLSTGDLDKLNIGRQIMARADFLFSGEEPGVWYPTYKAPVEPMPMRMRLPDIADWNGESLTARLIRLANHYGILYRNAAESQEQREFARHFCQEAISTATRLGEQSSLTGWRGFGMLNASLNLINDTHALVVGRDAVSQAVGLRSMFPGRLVAPVDDRLRPDLAKRGPGIYVIHGSTIRGPLTVEQAPTVFGEELRRSSSTPGP
jgi:uncharacterized protein YyaL (SSP411 family)